MFPRCVDCLKNQILRPYSLGRQRTNIRSISTSEIATALRPFYFAVHPDLFGQHPQQRTVNEESLKHLSAHLEALKQRRYLNNIPNVLKFYIRDSKNRDVFKLIQVQVGRMQEPKAIITNILKSCNLSTSYIENTIPAKQEPSEIPTSAHGDFRNEKDFESTVRQKPREVERDLRTWLKEHTANAIARSKEIEGLKEEVRKLEEHLVEKLELQEVRYDCGWNYEHYRGCLKTLERLANMHSKHAESLKGRVVVFGSFTGVSLEGHVMLFTGDVLNNWLDFIKNIPAQDESLKKIPSYEHALSQVLRKIKIARRKFMPKQHAVEYAGHLTKVTTTLLDYLTTNKYPTSWPASLSDYEIVIESESGPLMVSPTGQLIAPSSCPGSILIDFITTNLEEAKTKSEEYNKNKYIERDLHKRCIQQLRLKSLTKEDSVTPDKMINTLEDLLSTNIEYLANVNLNITNYYSVLTDGTVCIPWNFSKI